MKLYLIKQAWASLKQKPGFILSVTTSMGITLGALLCILTLAYLLLVEPLPYPDQNKLYRVDHTFIDAAGKENATAFTYPGLIHLYQQQDIFSESALIAYGEDVLTSRHDQPNMHTAYVTPQWFPLLGGSFILGRGFESSEALNSFNPVAILSYHSWKNDFNGDRNILSKTVTFRGKSFRIIGVVDPSFVEPQIHGLSLTTDIWFPWDYNLAPLRWHKMWINYHESMSFIGKLKPDLSSSQAEQTITSLIDDIWRENVAGDALFKNWHLRLSLNAFEQVILGNSQQTLYLLLLGVFGLVIIACANVANLFSSRAAEQQKSLAIHATLGAKQSKLFNYLFAQSGVLMLLSTVLALMIASFGFWLLQYYLSALLPRVQELTLNGFTLASALAFACLFAFVFARLSLSTVNYQDLNRQLTSSGKGSGIQVSKRVRQLLIISQVSIATVLVFVNLNLFQVSYNTINTPLGYDLDNTAYLTLSPSSHSLPPRQEVSSLMAEFRELLAQLPQVKAVSQSASPLGDFGTNALIVVESEERLSAQYKGVDHQYFQLLSQPLLEGNYFSASDIKDINMVIVINDVFAKKLAPTGSALGSKINFGVDGIATVIGVVKGVKMPEENTIPMRFYDAFPSDNQVLIKLHDNQSLSREQIVALLKEVTPLYAVSGFQNLTDKRQQRLFSQITTAVTTAVLALLSLFLAGIGLYGILSYSTQIRRFEIGTRLAIGAKRQVIIFMILKDNALSVLVGILSSMLTLVLLALHFSDSINNYLSWQLIPVFLITIILISAIAWCACYFPLRKFINRPAVFSLRGCG